MPSFFPWMDDVARELCLFRLIDMGLCCPIEVVHEQPNLMSVRMTEDLLGGVNAVQVVRQAQTGRQYDIHYYHRGEADPRDGSGTIKCVRVQRGLRFSGLRRAFAQATGLDI